jgi:hypothetical protein
MTGKSSHKQKNSLLGQSMVEFALAVPVVLLLIFGIIEFGYLFFFYSSVFTSTREATRYGSAAGLNANGVPRYQDCDGIRDAAIRTGSFAGVTGSNVEIKYDNGPSDTRAWADLPVCPADVPLGSRVVVKVNSTYTPLVPIIKIPAVTLYDTSNRTIIKDVDLAVGYIPSTPTPALPPILTSISPTSAQAGSPEFILTLNGSNFVNGSVARWENTNLITYYVSSTQLKAKIPDTFLVNVGTYLITVANPAPYGGVSSPKPFLVTYPMPAITSINPSTAEAGSPDITLTVIGDNFSNNCTVRWNGTGLATTFVNGNQLQAVIPAGNLATGATALITVFNSMGGGLLSNEVPFTVINPVPQIATLTPNKAGVGSPIINMVVTGNRFIPDTVIYWNSTALSTTYNSSTQVTAQIPSSQLQTGGTVSVTAKNPSPGGGTSNTLTFTIENPSPEINSLSPESVFTGSHDLTMTVIGSGFVNTSRILWNGSAMITLFIDGGHLQTTIPAALMASPGSAEITVFNGTPGGGTSNALPFSIVNPAPEILNLSPNGARVGSSALTMTVNGRNFVANSVVRWNGNDLATQFINTTQLQASIPAANLTAYSTTPITVFNPSPGGGISNSLNFIIYTIQITDISPSAVFSTDPAFTLTVNGGTFLNGSTILWNGIALPSTFVSASRLTASISNTLISATGTIPISVRNPNGELSNSINLTITNPVPALSSITPSTVHVNSGDFTMTLNGAQFTPNSTVNWNNTPLVTTYISATQLTAAVPAALFTYTGSAAITVTNPAPGGGTSGAQTIQIVNPVPSLTQLSPYTITAGSPDFTLNVMGQNFVQGAIIYWNQTALNTQYISQSQVSAAVPASYISSLGIIPVSVWNPAPGGGMSSVLYFTIAADCSKLTYGARSINKEKLSFPLYNSGSTTVTITSISISWTGPDLNNISINNPDLTIASGSFPETGKSFGVNIALNPGPVNSRTLLFQFFNPSFRLNGLSISFSNGCTLSP